jgi:monooxygenase
MDASRQPLDVLIVGAGLSGIGAAWMLERECPGKRIAIVEQRGSIGGTWDLFRYPGIRSDSDMHTLGYGFAPWTAAKAIADGPSILEYIRATAAQVKAAAHIRFHHRVRDARWSTRDQCWTVQLERTDGTGAHEPVSLQARFLYFCSGYYDYAGGHRPTFEGQHEFAGRILDPQFWPQDFDARNRRIVVVGSGATAVTLVPELAKTAAHVTMVQRSPSYVVAQPSVDTLANTLRRVLPAGTAYALTRWKNVLIRIAQYALSQRYPNFVKKAIVRDARRALGPDFDATQHFTPAYKPWDQRVCLAPDGDLFQTLRAGRADVVTGTIARFTREGIVMTDGRTIEADAVVLATGLSMAMLGHAQLHVDGRAITGPQSMVYKGMMLGGVPNHALAFGYTNASWTLKADLTAQYVCRLLRHMDAHGFAVAVPRPEPDVRPEPFLSFTSGYVQRAADVLPKQGHRKPWRVHQNYLKDMLTIRHQPIDDGVLRFTPAGQAVPPHTEGATSAVGTAER